jgi:cell division protein FtsQ
MLFAAFNRHPEIASVVSRAERIGGRRWSLVLTNGSRLELGADREVEGLEQIARNAELRRALTGQPMIADVRTAGRLTIRQAALGGGRTR